MGMLIDAASTHSGASILDIRLYEALGVIDTPLRDGKYRVYNAQTVDVLRCIKEAQRLGFSLKDILSLRTDGRSGLDPQRFAQAVESKKTQLLSITSQMQIQVQALEALRLEVASPELCQQWFVLPANPWISELLNEPAAE